MVTTESAGGEQSPPSGHSVVSDTGQGQHPQSALKSYTKSAADISQNSACPESDQLEDLAMPPRSKPAANSFSSSVNQGGGESEPRNELSQAAPRLEHTNDLPRKKCQPGENDLTPWPQRGEHCTCKVFPKYLLAGI